uniref:glycerol kinase n=1 Tax=Glossina pallidipes TaxID=7398 RepID=A0A1A9ZFU8_GLOPL
MPNIRDSNSSAPEFPSEGWIGTLLVLALGGLQHLKLICQQRCQMNQPLPLCQEYLLTQEMLIVIEMPKYISFSGHTLFESENYVYMRVTLAIWRKIGETPSKSRYLVGVIDDGTSTVSFSIYTTPEFKEIASHQLSVPMISPKPGWYEQDAMAVINNMYRCIEISMGMLASLGYKKEDLVTIGITNQRETTIMWDAITGKPLHNAIVWNDIRTSSTVDQIVAHIPEKDINHFKDKCGLPISPYFPALKIRWLMENVPAIQRACKENRCKAGTIDSWIIWHLTKGGLHITDVTNASRTLLMNISTLQWDHTLLKAFCIRVEMLPQIRSSSEIYGIVTDERTSLLGIKISGILGNQQASLLGQMCIKPGQAKNTYRAGCFLLCNTGHVPVISRHGLLTTVAYKLGSNNPATYALEGAVAVAGHALEWLEHQVRILPRAEDAEKYAAAVPTTGDSFQMVK